MFKKDHLAIGIVLSCLLTTATPAQSGGKRPEPTEIEHQTGHRTVKQSAESAFVIPEGVMIDDGLSEDEAVATALWNNAQLHADLAALGLARADLIDAGLISNPLFQFVLPIGPYRQFESLLNFPLDFFWQRRRRVDAASIELDRVAKGLEQNALNLARDVRLAFIDAKLAEHRAILAQKAVDMREQIVRLTNVRLRVGDIGEIEATAARLDESMARELAERQRREAVIALNRLRLLMGMNDSMPLQLIEQQDETEINPAALASGEAATSIELLSMALASRPDYRATELAIEVAAKRARWQRSRVGALAALLNIKRGEGVPFAPRPGAIVDLPIFNRNQGGIARADAEVARAAWQYIAVRQRIAGEVAEAVNQYRQARQSLSIWQSQVMPQAAENARLSESAFNRGDQSQLFVLDALRRVVDAGLRESELKADVRRAVAQIDRAVGQKSWRTLNANP